MYVTQQRSSMTSYAEIYDVMNMLYGTSPIETVTTCACPVIIKPYHHIAVNTYRNYVLCYPRNTLNMTLAFCHKLAQLFGGKFTTLLQHFVSFLCKNKMKYKERYKRQCGDRTVRVGLEILDSKGTGRCC